MRAREHFNGLLAFLQEQLAGEEGFTLGYNAEDSAFIRFNQGRVRQAGTVRQVYVTLALYRGLRHAESKLALSGEREADLPLLQQAVQQLRAILPGLPDDPYLRLNREAWRSESSDAVAPQDAAAMAVQISELAQGLDLVGFLAAGPQYQGFASSWGAFGWHVASSFNLEFSLFHGNAQAVKSTYAGERWDVEVFAGKLHGARQQLAYLGRPLRALAPGDYRTYLSPAALEELFGLFCWGFGAQALASGGSPLQRLFSGKAALSPMLSMDERIEGGLAPAFTREGPRQAATLIRAGQPGERLVSSRSAAEYGLTANGACSGEYPLSLRVHGGELEEGEGLARFTAMVRADLREDEPSRLLARGIASLERVTQEIDALRDRQRDADAGAVAYLDLCTMVASGWIALRILHRAGDDGVARRMKPAAACFLAELPIRAAATADLACLGADRLEDFRSLLD